MVRLWLLICGAIDVHVNVNASLRLSEHLFYHRPLVLLSVFPRSRHLLVKLEESGLGSKGVCFCVFNDHVFNYSFQDLRAYYLLDKQVYKKLELSKCKKLRFVWSVGVVKCLNILFDFHKFLHRRTVTQQPFYFWWITPTFFPTINAIPKPRKHPPEHFEKHANFMFE